MDSSNVAKPISLASLPKAKKKFGEGGESIGKEADRILEGHQVFTNEVTQIAQAEKKQKDQEKIQLEVAAQNIKKTSVYVSHDMERQLAYIQADLAGTGIKVTYGMVIEWALLKLSTASPEQKAKELRPFKVQRK